MATYFFHCLLNRYSICITLSTLWLLLVAGTPPLRGRHGVPAVGRALAADTFPFANRLAVFAAIDAQATQLWNSKKMKLLKTTSSATIPDLPVLLLYDRNGDRKAEEFAYTVSSKKESQEFGFYFDTDADGRPDYLIYNGGPMYSKDFSKMFWMNYHFMDTNGDGRIDIAVYNTVRLKGDDLYDEGISAWIYDRDYDGRFDSAEYLGKDFRQAIEKKDGAFLIKTPMGERPWPEQKDLTLQNNILKEVTVQGQ